MASSQTRTNRPSCTNKHFSESCHLLVLLNRRAVRIRLASDPARCDEEGGSSNTSTASAPLGHFPVCCGCTRTQNTTGRNNDSWLDKNAPQTEHSCSTRCRPNQKISNQHKRDLYHLLHHESRGTVSPVPVWSVYSPDIKFLKIF